MIANNSSIIGYNSATNFYVQPYQTFLICSDLNNTNLWKILENSYYSDSTLNINNFFNSLNNTSNITSLNTKLITDETNINNNTNSILSLNTRITIDESNINNNNNSIVSINSRSTADETNITNLLTNTLNQSYLPSINAILFNDNLLIGNTGTSFTFSLNGNTLNTVQPTFTIGSVTACNNGVNPSVSITGSYPNYTINFILEIGSEGQKVDTGQKGDTDPQGDSSTANAAAASAAVSATSSTAASASAAASEASSASALASVAGIQTQVDGLATNVSTLNTEVTTLNTNLNNLQLITTGMTYTGGNTNFAGSLNSPSLTTTTLNTTKVNSSNIGTTQTVVNLGNLTSQVYIGGILYDPFSSSTFFRQF